MSEIFLFISTLHLKQQTNIICAFLVQNLKLVYVAISFSDVYFAVIESFMLYKTENDQTKYFVQN